MSSDILSKFLAVSGQNPSAQNDNHADVSFSEGEKAYILDMAQKYGLASRAYADNDGERIDIFMNRMEQQYNLPSLCLTRHPEARDGSPYKVITNGNSGFMVPSNSFSSMQTTLSGLLMKHFQRQKLRALDV